MICLNKINVNFCGVYYIFNSKHMITSRQGWEKCKYTTEFSYCTFNAIMPLEDIL